MRNKDLSAMAVPIGVVGIVLLLVVPLPAALLDVLIAANITAALVILLTSMYVRRPLDFSVFPSLILVFTLFRLGLNVASTRLVLRDGYAGHVIDAFGHFVVGGSLVIGLVIFLILVVIQFVVPVTYASVAASLAPCATPARAASGTRPPVMESSAMRVGASTSTRKGCPGARSSWVSSPRVSARSTPSATPTAWSKARISSSAARARAVAMGELALTR